MEEIGWSGGGERKGGWGMTRGGIRNCNHLLAKNQEIFKLFNVIVGFFGGFIIPIAVRGTETRPKWLLMSLLLLIINYYLLIINYYLFIMNCSLLILDFKLIVHSSLYVYVNKSSVVR